MSRIDAACGSRWVSAASSSVAIPVASVLSAPRPVKQPRLPRVTGGQSYPKAHVAALHPRASAPGRSGYATPASEPPEICQNQYPPEPAGQFAAPLPEGGSPVAEVGFLVPVSVYLPEAALESGAERGIWAAMCW